MKLKTLMNAAMLALAVTTMAPLAQAHEAKKGDLTIIHPAARPNLPNRPTAAYMAIVNEGAEGDRLISARSDSFGAVEIHTTRKHGDVMKMEQVQGIDVPAGDTALLEPGGLHVMLFDAVKPHKIGESFMMTLTFEKAGDLEVEVKVEKISGGHDHSGHGHSGHKKPDQDHSGHDHSGHKHTN